jgi:hypothetical protein
MRMSTSRYVTASSDTEAIDKLRAASADVFYKTRELARAFENDGRPAIYYN